MLHAFSPKSEANSYFYTIKLDTVRSWIFFDTRAGTRKLCDGSTLLQILDTFSHSTLTDVAVRTAGQVKIDQTKRDLLALYTCRHLSPTFVGDKTYLSPTCVGDSNFCRRPVDQNTSSGCVLGGWAWLTSVTLAVVGRPSAY